MVYRPNSKPLEREYKINNKCNFSNLCRTHKMRYSIEARDQIIVNGYTFSTFAKNIGKNMSTNIHKN